MPQSSQSGGSRPKTTVNKSTITGYKQRIKQLSSKLNTANKRITALKKKK